MSFGFSSFLSDPSADVNVNLLVLHLLCMQTGGPEHLRRCMACSVALDNFLIELRHMRSFVVARIREMLVHRDDTDSDTDTDSEGMSSALSFSTALWFGIS